ncbi:MAG: hypothetical protein AB7G47_19975 [Mycolicibacterium sp.]|uniref:hypothetical protein n=1 Tax=Mycolicibacterium sp. TaxID=2320850 RepID=UPI003D1002BF
MIIRTADAAISTAQELLSSVATGAETFWVSTSVPPLAALLLTLADSEGQVGVQSAADIAGDPLGSRSEAGTGWDGVADACPHELLAMKLRRVAQLVPRQRDSIAKLMKRALEAA